MIDQSRSGNAKYTWWSLVIFKLLLPDLNIPLNAELVYINIFQSKSKIESCWFSGWDWLHREMWYIPQYITGSCFSWICKNTPRWIKTGSLSRGSFSGELLKMISPSFKYMALWKCLSNITDVIKIWSHSKFIFNFNYLLQF